MYIQEVGGGGGDKINRRTPKNLSCLCMSHKEGWGQIDPRGTRCISAPRTTVIHHTPHHVATSHTTLRTRRLI